MSTSAPITPVLAVNHLTIRFPRAPGAPAVVDGAALDIAPGEIRGLVGESGSGKTMLARATLDLLPPGAEVAAGSIRLQGRELRGLGQHEMRALRGAGIGMVFQEPMMSLNPALKIGRQMAEGMRLHSRLSETEIRSRSIEMLERVRMADARGALERYPHEFSGGMRQRIMLASVLMLQPALLLADEPTTALDVLIQQEVLEIMLEVVRDLGTAVLLITHDLGLVASYAHRVTVMSQGKVVEEGSVDAVLARPRHAYTRRLLAALPHRHAPSEPGKRTSETPLVEVRDLRVTFVRRSRLPWRRAVELHAVDGISFEVNANETLAVVGESGSGKTTLGRAILRLAPKSGGTVRIEGRELDTLRGPEERKLRRQLQIVFQDPYSSLDPRKRIAEIVGEGLRLVPHAGREWRRERIARTLEDVGLDPAWGGRFPHELSGGQRQRIGIARAIITEPRLVVADEAVSALDLTVQAQVLKLLKELQASRRFSYLFITHDLGVVEQIADRIVVMYKGQIIEIGSRDDIFDRPHHPYTCALLNAVPTLAGSAEEGYRLVRRRYAPPPPPAKRTADGRFKGESVPNAALVQVGDGHYATYGHPD